MKTCLIYLTLLLPVLSVRQGLKGKYINDYYNQDNYIIFNTDSTFKYRFEYHVMHDISCGTYRLKNDTIYLFYETDIRDTMCNKEIDISMYDSAVKIFRPNKLFYKDQKLYKFEDGKILNRIEIDKRQPKAWGYHRKYLLFGPYVKKDIYYMITESQVKWLR